jgi:type II secretory pathway pseudopilin PulG
MIKQKFHKKGFALTEVLMAIAVIIIFGIVAYPLYRTAHLNSQVETLANDVARIQTNTQSLFAGLPNAGYNLTNGGTLNTTFLNTLGLLPEDFTCSTTNNYCTTIEGPIFTVSPSLAGAAPNLPAGAGFTIGIVNLSSDMCVKLGQRVAPEFQGIGASASDDSIKGAGTDNTLTTQLDTNQLITVCQAVNASQTNGIFLTSN